MFNELLHILKGHGYPQKSMLFEMNQNMFRDSCVDHPPQENKKPTNPNANHMTEKSRIT